MRSTLFAAHIKYKGSNAITRTEHFARNQFIATNDPFGTAKIDNHIAIFNTFDDTVNDFANTIFILVILTIPFGITHFLHNDLFC